MRALSFSNEGVESVHGKVFLFFLSPSLACAFPQAFPQKKIGYDECNRTLRKHDSSEYTLVENKENIFDHISGEGSVRPRIHLFRL